jgi:hypothetical protein
MKWRFSQKTGEDFMKDQAERIKQRLLQNPELMDRIESILKIATNEEHRFETADAAEEQTRRELQKFGNEVLGEWAKEGSRGYEEQLKSALTNRKSRKKNFIGTVPMEPLQ